MQPVLGSQPVSRAPMRCPVCGFAEVSSDEVIDREVVLLAECPRCEQRWTWREDDPAAARPAAAQPRPSSGREVASAA